PLAMLLFAHYGRVLPAQMQVALLRALVVRLGRAERPYLRQGLRKELVVVFARLLHEDMDGSLQVLANLEVPSGSGHRNGLELLMSTWLTCAADMRARRARNITVSALCRLHERLKEDPQLRAKLGEAENRVPGCLNSRGFWGVASSSRTSGVGPVKRGPGPGEAGGPWAKGAAWMDSEDGELGSKPENLRGGDLGHRLISGHEIKLVGLQDEEESHDQKQNFFLSDVLDLEDCTN
ncbi:unnamed protein product, partial [Effrenium voratum]